MTDFVLTPRYRRQLQLLRSYRSGGPKVVALIRKNLLLHAFTFLVGLASLAFFVWGGWPDVGYMLFGASFAAFGRDLGWYRIVVRTWPLNEQITDWAKVDALLEGCDRVAS
jgi:hypothetical protein